MKTHGEFYPLLSLLAGEDFDPHIRRVIAFHTSHGWRVKRAESVYATAMPEKFKSISDIECDRVESASIPPPDHIPIKLVLEPTRPSLRQGAHERVVQLGPSSLDCTAAEHAVQILLLKEKDARSVASLKEVVQGVHPPVATIVSSLFRGPSLAELRAPENPFAVEMDKVFLGTEVLAGVPANKLIGLEADPWEGGTFFSGSSALVIEKCWPILRKWAFAHS